MPYFSYKRLCHKREEKNMVKPVAFKYDGRKIWEAASYTQWRVNWLSHLHLVYFILFYTITKFVGVNMSNTRTCSWLDNIHDISFSVLIYLYSMYDLKNTRHLGYFAGQIIWRIQKWNSSPSSSFILSRLCITIIFNFFFIE